MNVFLGVFHKNTMKMHVCLGVFHKNTKILNGNTRDATARALWERERAA